MRPPDEVYRSKTLLVRRRIPTQTDSTPWVITFDSYSDRRTTDRPGFGETFLAGHGLPAIHVISRDNNWYHEPDIHIALSTICDVIPSGARRITYGSSMGGYAAIRFSGSLKADTVIALSPQYSIDPIKVPFERRWQQEARSIVFDPQIEGDIGVKEPPLILFDPQLDDRHHAQLYSLETMCALIPLRGAGHPVGTALADMNLLSQFALNAIYGGGRHERIISDFRSRRNSSAMFLSQLSARQPRHRSKTAAHLAERAVSIAPKSDVTRYNYGLALTNMARHGEAVEQFQKAYDYSGRHPAYLHTLSRAHYLSGDKHTALSLAHQHVKECGHVALCHAWVAQILIDLRQPDEALAFAKEAARLDADNYTALKRAIVKQQRKVLKS